MTRVLTAAVLLILVWVTCRHARPEVFALVVGALAAAASWECFRLFESRGARPFRLVGAAAVLAICWSFAGAEPVWDPATPLVVATAASTLLAMWRRPTAGEMLDAATATVFPVALVGFGLGSVVAVRTVPGERGLGLVVLLVATVVASDTAAYYVGRAVGGPRLAPVVSPKKTWSGLAGGLAGSVAAALVVREALLDDLAVVHAIALGVLLAVAGVFGDLAESMIKRAAGAKDSSTVLPGHGGLLDRLDSMLLAAPVLYYYARTFLGEAP